MRIKGQTQLSFQTGTEKNQGIIKLPLSNRKYKLRIFSDASHKGLGALLMQKNGNQVVRVKVFNKLQIRTFHKRARVTRICLDSRSEVRGGIGPQGLRNCNKK